MPMYCTTRGHIEMFTFARGGVVEYHASQNATPATDLHFYSRDALPESLRK